MKDFTVIDESGQVWLMLRWQQQLFFEWDFVDSKRRESKEINEKMGILRMTKEIYSSDEQAPVVDDDRQF
jgi:hypothetical protein